MLDTIYDALSIVFILLAIVVYVFMIAFIIKMLFSKGRKVTVMVERYSSNDMKEEQNQMSASHANAHTHVSLVKRQMKRVDEEQKRR